MPVKLCTEIEFKGDKKKFGGAVDNLAKRQFYGPVKSVIVSYYTVCSNFVLFQKAMTVT